MDDQPVHAPFFAWPKQAYEGEYEDDEPVGCNEENTYLHEENVESKENDDPEKNAEPKVKKLPFGDTCGSTNFSKGMANRDWLADKGNGALEENPTVTAKQLR
ncbi:hypothetical protein ZWY2020_003357 [Hordeum vulgare]|nr:hypothetical protein ZWY2020_003357 [Hordeum vulgare]